MRIWLSVAAFAGSAALLAGAALADREATGIEVRVGVGGGALYTLDPIHPHFETGPLLYAMCLKLVNHRDAPARRSAELVPEAAAFPRISRDGRTYDFLLRTNLSRFSDGQRVDAMAFKRAIDRVAIVGSYGKELLRDVVGAPDVIQGRARSVSGVRARGRQLRITLVAPAGDLLRRLATPYFCAVPPGTPDTTATTNPIPSAGPYYVGEWVPDNFATLERNPHYRGSRPRLPDRIRITRIGHSGAPEEVQAGRVDLYRLHPGYPPFPADRTAAVGRLLVLQFNTQVGRRLVRQSLRKAIALALDRRAIARARGDQYEVPFDRFIPPTVPGTSRKPVYPLKRRARDLERARSLVAPFLPVTLRFLADGSEPAGYIDQVLTIARNIEETGIKVEVRFCPRCHYVDFDGDLRLRRGGLGTVGVAGDPVEYLRAALGGPSAIVDLANRLRGRARLAALRRLDTQLARDVVPAAALSIANEKHLVSTRLGCLEPHHVYAVNLGGLCLRS